MAYICDSLMLGFSFFGLLCSLSCLNIFLIHYKINLFSSEIFIAIYSRFLFFMLITILKKMTSQQKFSWNPLNLEALLNEPVKFFYTQVG